MVAPIFRDRVEEATSTTGTGNLALTGAAIGARSFNAAVPNGATIEFCTDNGAADWEIARGVFVSPSTLTRDTVLSSSNSGNLVSFGAGTKAVFLIVSAESLQALNAVRTNGQTANYTLAATDYDGRTLVDFNSSSNLVCTVPSEANVPAGNGVTVLISRSGNGTLTILGQANVTVENASSNTLRAQNSIAGLTRRNAPDIWRLFGDTT